jgi:hypothetical protein
MGGGLAACGGDSDPGGQDEEPEQCPAERAVRCPDDSCAADAEQCPGDEEPRLIDGDIVAMSPTTILGHAPEPVSLMLSVDDAERVQALVDEGANWRVKLEDGSEVELIEATASPSTEGGEHDFVVEFTPDADDGPKRVGLSIELVTGSDADAEVHSWGKVGLSLRGDASVLDFDGRDSYALEGVTNADRVWGDDLDGDGFGDLVVSNVQADAAGYLKTSLHVFKCGADKCEPAGVVETGAAGGDQITTLDMMVAPDMTAADAPQGFLAAAVTQRSAEGHISSVESIRIELVQDGAAHKVRETRASIDIAGAIGGARLHEQTLQPRLLLDRESGEHRPGVIVTRTIDNRGLLRWSTLVIDKDGVQSDFTGQRIFEGLNEEQTQSALGGRLAVCSPGDSKSLLPEKAPEGMILSAFEIDGKPAIGVASIPKIGGPVEVFLVEEYDLDILFGEHSGGGQAGNEYGSVKCQLGDLDDDGLDDLLVSVGRAGTYDKLGGAAGQPASVLLAMGEHSADAHQGVAKPELLINNVDASRTKALKKGDRLSLSTTPPAQSARAAGSISNRSARTGRMVNLDLDVDDQGAVSVSVLDTVSSPPGMPILSFDRIDAPEAIKGLRGNDIVLRKRPGRTSYANFTSGGPLTGSTQLVGDDHHLLLATFGPSIADNDTRQDGQAFLKSTDPETILGSIGTTGPFLPVQPSSGGGDLDLDGLSDVLYAPKADDQTTPLLYQGLVNDRGAPTSLVTGKIILGEDRDMVLVNERTIELDTSEVSLEGKRAVKFKAGAELSKSVNIAAPDGGGDCDDTNACPHPGQVLLAFELDTGEVLTGVVDTEADAAVVLAQSALYQTLLDDLGLDADANLSGLRTALRIGHDGLEPIVILHGINVRGDDLDEADEAFVTIDRNGEVLSHQSLRESSTQPVSLFGDVLGEGSDQAVVCKPARDEGQVKCVVGAIGADAETSSERIIANGDVVCVVDVDGDRCADLVTDAGEYISSRCDGQFEPAAVELRQWQAHLVCGDGVGAPGPSEAQDYNTSRSNKPSSIAWDASDEDDDDDGLPTALPFFDGVELPKWN